MTSPRPRGTVSSPQAPAKGGLPGASPASSTALEPGRRCPIDRGVQQQGQRRDGRSGGPQALGDRPCMVLVGTRRLHPSLHRAQARKTHTSLPACLFRSVGSVE